MSIRLKIPDPKKAYEFFEKKITFTAGPVEVKHMMDEGTPPTIIDVRAAEDFEEGHVPGAISLPEDKWSSLEGLKKDEVNVLYCYSIVCHLAARAAVYFASRGFPVMEMDGGWKSWEEHELPVESTSIMERKPRRQQEVSSSADRH